MPCCRLLLCSVLAFAASFWSATYVSFHKHTHSIAVFCGHRNDERFREISHEIGAFIARRSWRLVYGGGNSGLMGEVAAGAMERNGTVLGITLPEYATDEIHEQVVSSLGERKDAMLRITDAVVVLPGGIGTLDELLHVVAKKIDKLEGFTTPIVIVNFQGYWDPVLSLYQHSDTQTTLFPANLYETVHVVPDLPEAMQVLDEHLLHLLVK